MPIPYRRRTHVIILLIMVGALALRLIHANADFWFDEIITLQLYVRPPLEQVISTYIANNHVLNSILAHFLISSLGEAPWVVRLPAIAFGVASVWTFWMVASDVWRSPAGLLGTGLFALSYYGIYFSQNARGYSVFLFFALLATAMLVASTSGRAESAPACRVYRLCDRDWRRTLRDAVAGVRRHRSRDCNRCVQAMAAADPDRRWVRGGRRFSTFRWRVP
jgi:uncharacterized membrane protein